MGNTPRMSYAQVAQHHKDAQKEKREKQQEAAPVAVTQKATASVANYSNGNNNIGRNPIERDTRDSRGKYH